MAVDVVSNILNQLDREIWIITARAGVRQSGLVATNVSSASLVPALPRMTVGLANHHFTRELIDQSNAFCMHLIDESHLDWVWNFGIDSGRNTDKLSSFDTRPSAAGAPILNGAQSWLDCRVEARMDTGDRTVYLAEVLEGGGHQASKPLTFKRLLELAPADKLQQLKADVESHIEVDREAILAWRQNCK